MVDAELLGAVTRRRAIALAAAAVMAIAAAVAICADQRGAFLPSWIEWKTAEIACAPDGGEPECIVLEKKAVRVLTGGQTLWQSERELLVQDALFCDIDHDAQRELLLLCWRRGRYGESKPFWVTQEETGWSQHIYIYDCTADEIRPIWMASDIGMDAAAWRFDARERLVITDASGHQSAWDWLSWGLRQIELP